MDVKNPPTKKNPKKKHPGGRPTKINSISLKQVEKLAGFGLIDKQIAEIMGVCGDSVAVYKKNPAFSKAIQRGKAKADAKVVESLFHRACGCSHPEEKIFCYEINGKIKITRVKTTKHYPPDTAACFIWLKNRCGWRDKTEIEQTIKAYLYAENEDKTESDIEAESLRIATEIMAKRKGIGLPPEN